MASLQYYRALRNKVLLYRTAAGRDNTIAIHGTWQLDKFAARRIIRVYANNLVCAYAYSIENKI